MNVLTLNQFDDTLTLDPVSGSIISLFIGGKERLAARAPLFRVCLRAKNGTASCFSAWDAGKRTEDLTFSTFEVDITVKISIEKQGNAAGIKISVQNRTDGLVEWIELSGLCLPHLNKTAGTGGELLLPYNEGLVVSDDRKLRFEEPSYPSRGNYPVFPNMMFSQFTAYCFDGAENDEGCGLYIGAHDPARGPKGLWAEAAEEGIVPVLRIYCGKNRGEDYSMPFPVVLQSFRGGWNAAAELYRDWFEDHLPPRAEKIRRNPTLPGWYEDAPLVVSYPVRGIHDMDKMEPNRLFPYANALPLLDGIHRETASRLLVLLMHWEGTAPWAPPYVWPPYGGEQQFNAFADALHAAGDLLGVYCSGFGYTLQSNLIEEYNRETAYKDQHLEEAMCAGPDGRVEISKICTFQRSGYDICPASEKGRELLEEAYRPLFESGIDYAQILDQNHGGSQYFCYSEQHGHAPSPGPWMTENMQALLTRWNTVNEGPQAKLFGCESAAAEPYIGNLLFSDNRFELCWYMGRPIPLYSFLFHEYVRNFMGNQVSCPFPTELDTLRMRLAYAFAAGDCMTLVLTPDGELMVNWGTRDFVHHPDRKKTLLFVKTLTGFYQEEGKKYLYDGRMIRTRPFVCPSVSYAEPAGPVPAVFTSAWTAADGSSAQIFVNHTDTEQVCLFCGKEIKIPACSAMLKKI